AAMTVRVCPENLIRFRFEFACSPSPASSAPAFASSSLNFPISARSFWLGITPASESLLALTMTMNRIASISFTGLIRLHCHVESATAESTRAAVVHDLDNGAATQPYSEMRAQIREPVDNEQTAVSATDLLLLQHPGVWVRDEYRIEPGFERRIDIGLGAVADHPRSGGLHPAFHR